MNLIIKVSSEIPNQSEAIDTLLVGATGVATIPEAQSKISALIRTAAHETIILGDPHDTTFRLTVLIPGIRTLMEEPKLQQQMMGMAVNLIGPPMAIHAHTETESVKETFFDLVNTLGWLGEYLGPQVAVRSLEFIEVPVGEQKRRMTAIVFNGFLHETAFVNYVGNRNYYYPV